MSLAWWAIDIDPVIAVVSLEFLVRPQDSSPPTQNNEEPIIYTKNGKTNRFHMVSNELNYGEIYTY